MSKTQASLLLVEDDQALANLISEELEAEGFQLAVAETLAEAHAWLEQQQPALIITDLRLPDGHGMALVKA